MPITATLSLGQGLAVLDLLCSVLLETDGLDLNESGGVHGAEALQGVHGSILHRVEVACVALATLDVHSTLVCHQANLASNILLAEDNGVLNLYKMLDVTNLLKTLVQLGKHTNSRSGLKYYNL